MRFMLRCPKAVARLVAYKFFPLVVVLAAITTSEAERLPTEQTAIPVLVQEAHTSYEKHNFETAADLYQSAIRAGANSADVYYNAGLASYYAGRKGLSILDLRRALRLSPRDSEAEHALTLARGSSALPPRPGWREELLHWCSRLSPHEWESVFAVAWIFLWLAFATEFHSKRSLRRAIITVGAVIALTSGTVLLFTEEDPLGNGYSWKAQPGLGDPAAAVVVSDKVEVHGGPDAASSVIAVLPEGTEVKWAEQTEPWMRIVLPDKRSGWVLAENVPVV